MAQDSETIDLVPVRIPVVLTFAALIIGLSLGMMLGTGLATPLVAFLGPIGAMWLKALQMTIIPLVASLLVLGLGQMVKAAQAGRASTIMLGLVSVILLLSGAASALLMPLLLAEFPISSEAAADLAAPAMSQADLPEIGDFVASLIAPNIVEAAAENAMLPLTIFFALLAVAIAKIPEEQSVFLTRFFHAMANTMLLIIGWVLWLAPLGVFALAFGVGTQSGGAAFAALGHYILSVSAMGAVVLIAAYGLAVFIGRQSLAAFAKALLPAQAVALSTQSSLASLPAMLESARRLGISERTRDFALPLAVAIFRATSPAMNMAVAIYAAHLAGVALHPAALVAAVGVAFIISVGSVSLPGTISFVISVGPIAIAMGAPIEILALLVAVEMLPDIMRTLGNVTMNVALASAVERFAGKAD